MKSGMTGPEHPGAAERLKQGVNLAVGIGIGVLAVGGAYVVWKDSREGNRSVTDYAKDRARKFLGQAKPLAGLAFDYLQGRVSKLFHGETNQVAHGAQEFRSSFGWSDKGELVEFEAREETPLFDMSKVFESGSSLVAALGNDTTPQGARQALQKLALAWKYTDAIPQAAELWKAHIGPALQEAPTAVSYHPFLTVRELAITADHLSQNLAAAAHNIRDQKPNSQGEAFDLYTTQVRIDGAGYGSDNERGKLGKLGTDYVSSLEQFDPESVAKSLHLTDNTVSAAVATFLATTQYDLSPQEAESMVQTIKTQHAGEITIETVQKTAQTWVEEADQTEEKPATDRRVALYSSLQTLLTLRNYYLDLSPENGARASLNGPTQLRTIEAALSNLDMAVQKSGHNMAHEDVVMCMEHAARILAQFTGGIDEDLRTITAVHDALANLQKQL